LLVLSFGVWEVRETNTEGGVEHFELPLDRKALVWVLMGRVDERSVELYTPRGMTLRRRDGRYSAETGYFR
jgi:hypothetical protein